MNELRVAVVGAGPAGMYVADALTFQTEVPVRVDIFDRLPTPFGLLRYGVAPDHLKMKSLARALQRTLDDERVQFFGNLDIGRDVTVEELRSSYHAVVYSFGASADCPLGIDGEDLAGSASATEFVSWYSGHPDLPTDRFDLSSVTTAVVVGVGNVALDVTRMMVKSVDALTQTDIPAAVLEALAASSITDVHILGRRGPSQAKFTTKELRELGELGGVDVIVDPTQLEMTAEEEEVAKDPVGGPQNLDVLREWAERPLTGAPRRIHLHWRTRPVAAVGERDLRAVVVEPTNLRDGRLVQGGPPRTIEAQLLLRSVGYRGVGIPGVPLHPETATIPHVEGRVRRAGRVCPGEYVAGWIGRGPAGVLGTNRSDATAVVSQLIADAPRLLEQPVTPDGTARWSGRGARIVDCAGWAAIDRAEIDLGTRLGRARSKLETWDKLLAASGPTS